MDIREKFNYYYYEQADPRVTDWPLMGSMWPTFFILVSYVYVVFQCGPRYMKNKPAYDLRTFIRCYNIFQIVTNAYIVREILAVYPDAAALRCVPGDYSTTPSALRIARACYWVSLLKVIDLIETVIFVLRKKNNQITFLHVYHHITTVLAALISLRYVATGMAVFYPATNCSVHVIMYTYYLLSSIEGINKKVYPFKKYVTIIQMVQFVFLICHAIISLLPSCPVPRLPGLAMLPNVIFNFTLFYNFYKKSYMQPKKKKE
ncbi:elongation of very long chain fatty acids protein 4-like [Belonocnema kinseyi]|uniref:elongation of very long chain fatty acids protein 4-like n=1 Tax=Belonocnema kinseyi TaxID=2817044 RepID=UPI00143DA258|nr:elongation of very long chain fatty acids protein 4-like [Belonocnema kinseyi]